MPNTWMGWRWRPSRLDYDIVQPGESKPAQRHDFVSILNYPLNTLQGHSTREYRNAASTWNNIPKAHIMPRPHETVNLPSSTRGTAIIRDKVSMIRHGFHTSWWGSSTPGLSTKTSHIKWLEIQSRNWPVQWLYITTYKIILNQPLHFTAIPLSDLSCRGLWIRLLIIM